MKKILFVIFSFILINSYSQEHTFGTLNENDLDILITPLDTTANAIVLYESGNTKFIPKNGRIRTETKFYFKKKIFNKESDKHAIFKILLYNNKKLKEEVLDIKGITHNGLHKTHLSKQQIFVNKLSENWTEVSFTLPNIKQNSIIEVTYTIHSPFLYNLTGWEFQSSIPKLYSEYKASIPGIYTYNRTLNGNLLLSTNSSTIKRSNFSIPGMSGEADTEEVHYAMTKIPPFIEEEYLSSKDNFIAKIKFELARSKWFDGSINKYTTSWEAVDKEFMFDKNIGGQLRKTNILKKLLPTAVLEIEDDLEKSKAIFNYIKNYFSWNNKYSIFKNVRIREALDDKIGNVGEINISLINALKAAGLNAEMVLLSTRENGFPTKKHPVISDFNYVVAKLNIGDMHYFLDATEKANPFGILPYRCLNSFGRVMDFENPSYWISLKPTVNSERKLTSFLELNEDGIIKGKIRVVHTGYLAISRRNAIYSKTKDEIADDFEANFYNVEIENYEHENLDNVNLPLIETYQVSLEPEDENSNWIINPYFETEFSKNPFTLKYRNYPIDFGYKRTYQSILTLLLPDNYKVKSLPANKLLKTPSKTISYNLKVLNNGGVRISLNNKIQIDKSLYNIDEYYAIKTIFKEIINSQKERIILENTNIQ